MDWLAANGFWVLIFIAFIGMHMFCHGGHHRHGGHSGGDRQPGDGEQENRGVQGRAPNASSDGHQH